MSLRDFKQRFEHVKRVASGRWGEVLPSLGLDAAFLRKNHGPCPCCGGTDRFRYMDEEGKGTWYCNSHRAGSGDGFQLLMDCNHWSLADAVKAVEDCLGGSAMMARPRLMPSPVVKSTKDTDQQRNRLRKTWLGSRGVSAGDGDGVSKYLGNRGVLIPSVPKVLRFHPSIPFHHVVDEGGKDRAVVLGHYQAMLAMVQGPDGKPISIHRTYLKDGQKARIIAPEGEILSARKVMSKVKGGAIRLFTPWDDRLAIAEGIETALAVHLMTGLPVWAGISSSIMKGMILPNAIRRVYIFADNDPVDVNGKRAGPDGAHDLAIRLRNEGRKAYVTMPSIVGADFLDVYLQQQSQKLAA